MPAANSQRLKAIIIFWGTTLAVLVSCSSVNCDSNCGLVVGWAERVSVHPGNVILSAKVDTGAVTCSLHAAHVQEIERNGRAWVRLTLTGENGKNVLVECPVVGTRRIKRHFGRFQERLVVKLTICLGPLFKEVEVNLVDRTGFEYPMLIGRQFLDGDVLVNPSVKFTVEPHCNGTLLRPENR